MATSMLYSLLLNSSIPWRYHHRFGIVIYSGRFHCASLFLVDRLMYRLDAWWINYLCVPYSLSIILPWHDKIYLCIFFNIMFVCWQEGSKIRFEYKYPIYMLFIIVSSVFALCHNEYIHRKLANGKENKKYGTLQSDLVTMNGMSNDEFKHCVNWMCQLGKQEYQHHTCSMFTFTQKRFIIKSYINTHTHARLTQTITRTAGYGNKNSTRTFPSIPGWPNFFFRVFNSIYVTYH